jgi:glycosyltransferase involved in cell wall biosynthesis
LNPPAPPFISVIVPNHNGEKTIGLCLDAAFASQYDNFEVVVVDDCSTDNSTAIIEKYPGRFFRLAQHGGASKARNTGAQNSTGELLFFIDSDCILQPDTLAKAAGAYQEEGPGVIIGGTYTLLPYDRNFFSIFQSVYIHYSETKNPGSPDYVATHAMLIEKELFRKGGGFNEAFMPILEDVEFCHRLKKMGARLRMAPEMQVQHIFNFSLARSMRNGIRKSKYWSIYSIKNRDLLADSGTASREFKFNVLSCFLNILLVFLAVLLRNWVLLLPLLLLSGTNLYLNAHLVRSFYRAAGPFFAIPAVLYYTLVYPFAVGIGVCSALFSQHFGLRP